MLFLPTTDYRNGCESWAMTILVTRNVSMLSNGTIVLSVINQVVMDGDVDKYVCVGKMAAQKKTWFFGHIRLKKTE